MSIDNNQEYEAELITLIDDEGTEHEFEIIDELENDDGYFMALVPTLRDAQSEVADADEYYIFEVVEDENGEEQLCEIEDDDLLDKLAEIFELCTGYGGRRGVIFFPRSRSCKDTCPMRGPCKITLHSTFRELGSAGGLQTSRPGLTGYRKKGARNLREGTHLLIT